MNKNIFFLQKIKKCKSYFPLHTDIKDFYCELKLFCEGMKPDISSKGKNRVREFWKQGDEEDTSREDGGG